jgi:phosphatidylserine/phosphatidylglycerophosphate/cardiolipin synthase-like enzyme
MVEPKVRTICDNDRFWDLLWEKIDRAKHYALVTTYDMDDSMIAGITLQKLTNAAKRGVPVYLIVDDLNFKVNRKAVKKLEKAGGICIKNNPVYKFWHYLFSFDKSTAKFFNRNHQKVKLIDDYQFVGSLNINHEYGGVRYGNALFRDMNTYVQGHSTRKIRHFFRDILLFNAEDHLHKVTEDRIIKQFEEFDRLFPEKDDSKNDMLTNFLREEPPDKSEVTDLYAQMIKLA